MFYTNPTIVELKLLDLSNLMEMLTKQTEDYIQFIKDEGFTSRTLSARELLQNIQEAIESKQFSERMAIEKANVIPTQSNFGASIQKTS